MILILFSALTFLHPESVQAVFVLDSPTYIASAGSMELATSQDGQEILITWSWLDSVKYRVSHDGGLSFSPVMTVMEAPQSTLEGLWFDIEYDNACVMSADGSVAHVMAGLVIETDPWFPPPGWPPALKVTLFRLYTSYDLDRGFDKAQYITSVSADRSWFFGLGHSYVRDFVLAANDSADIFAAALGAFNMARMGDTYFSQGEAGGYKFSRPKNLSRAVLPHPYGNDYDQRIVMDATGQKIFVCWTEISDDTDFSGNLAHSLDGGETWSEPFVEDTWYDSDLDYADAAERLVWAYDTGYYFYDPLDPSRIAVRISDDDGMTMGEPTTVALAHTLPDSSTMQVTYPVRVAVSADGQVIAILHTEEHCTTAFGCTGGSIEPWQIVLSVSEDGGSTYERVGLVAISSYATFDLAVRQDGQEVFITSESEDAGGTIFLKAVRQ